MKRYGFDDRLLEMFAAQRDLPLYLFWPWRWI